MARRASADVIRRQPEFQFITSGNSSMTSHFTEDAELNHFYSNDKRESCVVPKWTPHPRNFEIFVSKRSQKGSGLTCDKNAVGVESRERNNKTSYPSVKTNESNSQRSNAKKNTKVSATASSKVSHNIKPKQTLETTNKDKCRTSSSNVNIHLSNKGIFYNLKRMDICNSVNDSIQNSCEEDTISGKHVKLVNNGKPNGITGDIFDEAIHTTKPQHVNVSYNDDLLTSPISQPHKQINEPVQNTSDSASTRHHRKQENSSHGNCYDAKLEASNVYLRSQNRAFTRTSQHFKGVQRPGLTSLQLHYSQTNTKHNDQIIFTHLLKNAHVQNSLIGENVYKMERRLWLRRRDPLRSTSFYDQLRPSTSKGHTSSRGQGHCKNRRESQSDDLNAKTDKVLRSHTAPPGRSRRTIAGEKASVMLI